FFHFTDQLTSNTGIQFSLLCTGIWLLNHSLSAAALRSRLLWLSGACLVFITSVWVADFAALSLLLILLMTVWRLLPLFRKDHFFIFISHKEIKYRILVTTAWVLAGVAFIIYAKHRTGGMNDHSVLFSSPGQIAATLKSIFSTLTGLLLFRNGNISGSIFCWFLLGGIPWVLMLSRKRRAIQSFLRKNKWILLFVLNGLITFLILLIFNGMFIPDLKNGWFSIVFLSFSIALLLYIEGTGSGKRSLRSLLLFLIVIPGSISALTPFYFPHRATAAIDVVAEFDRLGNIGIISAYDYAYLIASANPKQLHATPHDSALIRNPQLVLDVFRQPKLYVIRDRWLKSFPDTLRQFGQILLKKGNSFNIAGLDVCRYEKYIYFEVFGPGQMKYQGELLNDPDGKSQQVVRIGKDFDRSKHFVFGPFIPLNQGKIKAEYRLKASDNLSTDPAAVLEVSVEFGKKMLATRTIRWSDFQKIRHFETFEMVIEIPENYKGVEFRIMYLGGHELWFDQVKMTGM
ncbi:MAG TPA: hypothetical protein VLR52_00390, partial [Bacteroidales bacterium]|nr:hypothetical protein [Bacteroidales bacterium]